MDRDETRRCSIKALKCKAAYFMPGDIQRPEKFQSPSLRDWIAYFSVFVIIQVPAIMNFYDNTGGNNPYILFADALLHGKIVLSPSARLSDVIWFQSNYYLPYPPLPAIVLLPFVALFGAANVNTVAVATLMGCASLYLVHKILVRLNVAPAYLNWMMVGFLFGTGYWFAIITSHHVYAFAHITAVLFQLLLIDELLGKRRWWLAGVYIGCAFLSRQLTLLYLFFALAYMIYLYRTGKESVTFRHFLMLSGTVGVFVLFYLFYNFIRFGNPLDSGYGYILYIGVLGERVSEYGVFSARYFLFNLYSFLIKGFNIELVGKAYLRIKDVDLWGTSLLSASPFLIASLKAAWPLILRVGAWATIIVILFVQLFYHNNGYHQVNTSRFTLDFLPLLFVLAALGANHIPKWLLKGMIGYAVMLNIVSFVIHYFYQ